MKAWKEMLQYILIDPMDSQKKFSHQKFGIASITYTAECEKIKFFVVLDKFVNVYHIQINILKGVLSHRNEEELDNIIKKDGKEYERYWKFTTPMMWDIMLEQTIKIN